MMRWLDLIFPRRELAECSIRQQNARAVFDDAKKRLDDATYKVAGIGIALREHPAVQESFKARVALHQYDAAKEDLERAANTLQAAVRETVKQLDGRP